MKKHLIIVLIVPLLMFLLLVLMFSCGNDKKKFRIDHVMEDNIDGQNTKKTTDDDANDDAGKLNTDNEIDIDNKSDDENKDENSIENEGSLSEEDNSDSPYRYIKAKSGLRMRKEPELDAELILSIPFNKRVEIIEERDEGFIIDGVYGNWTRVSYDNTLGWVFGGFLSLKPEQEEEIIDMSYVIAKSGLRMRSEPSIKGDVVTKIPFNSKVGVIEETGDEFEADGELGRWTKVTWQNNLGWVFGGFLGEGSSLASSWIQSFEDKAPAYSVSLTNDSGYIAAGSNKDFYVTKLYPSVEEGVEWDFTFGGLKADKASSVIQTSDGGYIVAGVSDSDDIIPSIGENSTEDADFYIIKLNKNGKKEWDAMYYGASLSGDVSIRQSKDFGYIISGTIEEDDYIPDKGVNKGLKDIYLLKLDSEGEKEWDAIYGGNDWDECSSEVLQTVDGGYIVTGFTLSDDISPSKGTNQVFISGNVGSTGDMYVLKLSSEGEKQWDAMYGGTGNDWASTISETNDGGFIIAGWSNSTDIFPTKGKNNTFSNSVFNYDYYVIKLSESGSKEWDGMYGGSSDDEAQSIIQTSDGGFLITGGTKSNDVSFSYGELKADSGIFTVKLSRQGSLEWTSVYGDEGKNIAYSIKETQDKGFVLSGSCSSKDFCVLKFKADGSFLK